MFAVVGDVGGGDAAAVLEHNGIGGRGRHGEQEQSCKWRCAMHILNFSNGACSPSRLACWSMP